MMEAAWVNDGYWQAGSAQGDSQIQVLNPRSFKHHAGHPAAKLLAQGLMPLWGLAELLSGECASSTSHTPHNRFGADINAYIVLPGVPLNYVIGDNGRRFPDLALLTATTL